MGITTRGYPYPDYSDLTNFPAQLQALATAVDTDVTTVATDIVAALEEPVVRLTKSASQAVANNTNVTLTWGTEVFDTDNMANLGVDATRIQLQTPGAYLISGHVNMAPAAAGGVGVVLTSSAGTSPNPIGISRALDNDKNTNLSWTVLHRTVAVPDNITVFVRQNSGGAINAVSGSFSATKVSD
jgi:hypothetical protein